MKRHRARPVWLFDLDDTLHNATAASMGPLREAMGAYIEAELGLDTAASNALRRRYWLRYGATLLGLVRHHGVDAAHFLHHTHQLPGLEARVHGHRHDLAALRRLPGRRYVLTNAPAAYAARVLGALGIGHWFNGVLSIEDLRMFGHLRPKPDTRAMRSVAARLAVSPSRCVLVEDAVGNLKGARRAGCRTVWLRRWLPDGTRQHHRPAGVDHRIDRLQQLLSLYRR